MLQRIVLAANPTHSPCKHPCKNAPGVLVGSLKSIIAPEAASHNSGPRYAVQNFPAHHAWSATGFLEQGGASVGCLPILHVVL